MARGSRAPVGVPGTDQLPQSTNRPNICRSGGLAWAVPAARAKPATATPPDSSVPAKIRLTARGVFMVGSFRFSPFRSARLVCRRPLAKFLRSLRYRSKRSEGGVETGYSFAVQAIWAMSAAPSSQGAHRLLPRVASNIVSGRTVCN
jgi:hypothetical protein